MNLYPTFEIPKDLVERLLANDEGHDRAPYDPIPVVKLFTPDANATWLLYAMDALDRDLAWGLCDLGLGFPEMGSVSISEIRSISGPMGLPVERDLHFKTDLPISIWSAAAHRAGRIVDPKGSS